MIPDELNNKLGFNIYRAGLLFRRELMHAVSDYNMTPEQWQIMMTLWSAGKPVNQSEIVEMTLKDKHTLSRIIGRLERDGWIEKVRDPGDKRITLIRITEKGNLIQGEAVEKMQSHFKGIWSDFNKEEKQDLLKTLQKLRSILGDF